MSAFNRDRYIFSTISKMEVVKERKISYGKQISLFMRELKLYGVTNKNLISKRPNYETRNHLLNLALYIIEDDVIFNEFITKRELPIGKIIRLTGVSRITIENWRDYLISYVLLISNQSYADLKEYFNIKEKVDETALTVLKENEKGQEFLGISIRNSKKYSDILTKMGEFIRIKNSDEDRILGQELQGKEKKGIKNYAKAVVIFAIALGVIIAGSLYIYNENYTTVVVNTSSKIVFEVNRFKLINEAYSQNSKNQQILDSLNIDNMNINDGITEVFRYLNNKKYISDKEILIVISGHKLDDTDLQSLKQFIKDNNKSKPKDKVKVIINNFGKEEKVDY